MVHKLFTWWTGLVRLWASLHHVSYMCWVESKKNIQISYQSFWEWTTRGLWAVLCKIFIFLFRVGSLMPFAVVLLHRNPTDHLPVKLDLRYLWLFRYILCRWRLRRWHVYSFLSYCGTAHADYPVQPSVYSKQTWNLKSSSVAGERITGPRVIYSALDLQTQCKHVDSSLDRSGSI